MISDDCYQCAHPVSDHKSFKHVIDEYKFHTGIICKKCRYLCAQMIISKGEMDEIYDLLVSTKWTGQNS